jgi:hypothetical protein
MLHRIMKKLRISSLMKIRMMNKVKKKMKRWLHQRKTRRIPRTNRILQATEIPSLTKTKRRKKRQKMKN